MQSNDSKCRAQEKRRQLEEWADDLATTDQRFNRQSVSL